MTRSDKKAANCKPLHTQPFAIPQVPPGHVMSGARIEALQDLMQRADIVGAILVDPDEPADRKAQASKTLPILFETAQIIWDHLVAEHQAWDAQTRMAALGSLEDVGDYLENPIRGLSSAEKRAHLLERLLQNDGALLSTFLRFSALERARRCGSRRGGGAWSTLAERGTLPVGHLSIERAIREADHRVFTWTELMAQEALQCALLDGDETVALILTAEDGGATCTACFLADAIDEEAGRAVVASGEVRFHIVDNPHSRQPAEQPAGSIHGQCGRVVGATGGHCAEASRASKA